MGDWRAIESAPKDGCRVWVKRVYQGRIVKEGWAKFGLPHASSPMRQPLDPDPLGRPEQVWVTEMPKVAQRWLNEDGMHAFPTPTHWMPLPNAPTEDA